MQVISWLDSKRKTIWLDLFRLGTSLNARCCLNVRFLVERGYGGTIYICRTLFPRRVPVRRERPAPPQDCRLSHFIDEPTILVVTPCLVVHAVAQRTLPLPRRLVAQTK